MTNYYSDTITNAPKTGNDLYRKVLLWITAQFAVMAVGVYFVGPLVPQSMITPLYLILLGAMLLSAFTRSSILTGPVMAIAVPFILGITLYGTLKYFVSTGSGDIILSAAIGTAIIFGIMAFIGYTSKKSLNSIAGKLFAVLLGLIAISLLNSFLFQITGLSLVISFAAIAIFSIYIFIDIQAIRDDVNGDIPASVHALNIFLDIYNIFISLLNILSIFRD